VGDILPWATFCRILSRDALSRDALSRDVLPWYRKKISFDLAKNALADRSKI
jgi:hypothetical protein